MGIQQIQAALENHLLAMATIPAISTAFENRVFAPVVGQPYQRVSHLLGRPTDHAITCDMVEDKGIMQVTLMYPLDKGRMAAVVRADALRQHFAPPLTLTFGGIKVQVSKTPYVAAGMQDGDRWAVPVSIYWSSI